MDLYASITAVIGFNLKIGSNLSGTISEEYMIGVKNCHAIDTILNIYATSLIYTVIAQVNNVIPNVKINSTSIIIGISNNALKFNPNPLKINTANTTKKHNAIFTKLLIVLESGNTSLGKYIFFIISEEERMHVEPLTKAELINVHGTNATNKNI